MSKKLKYKPGDFVRFHWDDDHPKNNLRVLHHHGGGDYRVYDSRFDRERVVNAWQTVKVVDSVPEELLWD